MKSEREKSRKWEKGFFSQSITSRSTEENIYTSISRKAKWEYKRRGSEIENKKKGKREIIWGPKMLPLFLLLRGPAGLIIVKDGRETITDYMYLKIKRRGKSRRTYYIKIKRKEFNKSISNSNCK